MLEILPTPAAVPEARFRLILSDSTDYEIAVLATELPIKILRLPW
jgi:hypothetical protein